MTDHPEFDQAACRGMDTDLFFPHRSSAAEAPLKVCRTCPIDTRLECLQYALETRSEGVWGGKTENQRLEILGIRRPDQLDLGLEDEL